jgi:[protein-PII] uridylyltransferase
MSEFYGHTATVQRVARLVMRRCLERRLDLGVGGLASIRREIAITDAGKAGQDAVLPLHACELAQAYDLGFDDGFMELLSDYFARHPSPGRLDLCGRVFTRILAAPRGVAKALNTMADQGALGWLLPEFGSVRNLIPYDASHDYTVGEHCLRVAEYLEHLRFSDDPKLVEYKRVWLDVSMPEVLYLAALIHDLGKDNPSTGSHSEAGAHIAQTIGSRLCWSEERTARLVFLVRHHLLMAETSRLRDMNLEETIWNFTRTVGDLDLLNMLYLLTCADSHEVGAGVWTEMKGKFLTELYERSAAVLSVVQDSATQADPYSYVPDLAKHRERIKRQLAQHNLPLEAIHEHTIRMPAQYLLNTSLEDMYLHMAMITRLRQTGVPTIDLKTEFGDDFTEMTVVAYDETRPGLFAKIAGVLFALDVNLHGSQVFTRESSVRIALDTLWIDYRGKPLSPSKKTEVQETMRQVLMATLMLPDLFAKRKKAPTEQKIDAARLSESASERYSLLDIRAADEPGVVYRLSNAISKLGWNIHSARVSVWGSRVRAAFYITDVDGRKIPEADLPRLLEVLPREEYRGRRLPSA